MYCPFLDGLHIYSKTEQLEDLHEIRLDDSHTLCDGLYTVAEYDYYFSCMSGMT